MLGSGKSSLAIWTAFNTAATASVRVLKWALKIAWKRVEGNGIWATVGSSLVGGFDMVQGQTSIISKSDIFQYYNETNRVTKIEYEREVSEPLGGIALAQADIGLENSDGRFTPNKGLTCGTAIYPNRPMIIHLGFNTIDRDITIPIFKGLSDQPKEDKVSRILNIHAYDYLKYLNQYSLESTIYTNQRSDQIISDILNTIGFSTDQYSLDVGLNTIEYAWFTKGTMAGEAIGKICEAEEAYFYQDEEGILRFENRRKYSFSPFNSVVWTIKADDIIEWEQDDSTQIINRVIVKADSRTVLSSMEIWRNSEIKTILPRETITIWAYFENPCTSITTPVATTDYLANTSSDGSGTDVTANVTVSLTNFTNTAKLVITNNYTSTVYITFFKLRGTPAVIDSSIQEIYQDDDSIEKYQIQQIEVNNDFIDNQSFAYYMARAIVRKYKNPLKRINIIIRGIPTLQLKDLVSVYDRDLDNYKNYRIMKIAGILREYSFQQILTLRESTIGEADSWAIVGQSTVAGYGVVGT